MLEIIMTGGSHTNFDSQAFTAGAIGGASLLAGAMVAGLRNAAGIRRDRNTQVAVSVRDDIIAQMQRRVNNQRAELRRRDATIADQALHIKELQVRLTMAQFLRQRGR
jgi:hypothetical protein